MITMPTLFTASSAWQTLSLERWLTWTLRPAWRIEKGCYFNLHHELMKWSEEVKWRSSRQMNHLHEAWLPLASPRVGRSVAEERFITHCSFLLLKYFNLPTFNSVYIVRQTMYLIRVWDAGNQQPQGVPSSPYSEGELDSIKEPENPRYLDFRKGHRKHLGTYLRMTTLARCEWVHTN